MADRIHAHAYLAVGVALLAFHVVTNMAGLPALVGILAGFVAWGVVNHFRPRPIPPGHCQTCGYNLTGNVSGRCPECGTDVAADV